MADDAVTHHKGIVGCGIEIELMGDLACNGKVGTERVSPRVCPGVGHQVEDSRGHGEAISEIAAITEGQLHVSIIGVPVMIHRRYQSVVVSEPN